MLGGLSPEDRVVVGPFRSLDQLKDGSIVKDLALDEDEKPTGDDQEEPTTRTADGDDEETDPPAAVEPTALAGNR